MQAVIRTEKASLRNIFTSARALELGLSIVCACALALAFPKFNAAWLAPIGAAGLFWVWGRLPWKRAFAYGWFAGTIFFCISFAWFGYTVGKMVGPFSFALIFIPSLAEGLAFGAAAACTAIAFARAPRAVAPLAAAAAFAVFEWIRSIGLTGVPFAQLGYSQADTPLAVFAAYIGTFGVTFVICTFGAYLAQAVALRNNRTFLIATAVLVAIWGICWMAWPARYASPATIRVAAVQGNISQSEKSWNPAALAIAADRYTSLTESARAYQPALIVWPETVMTTALNDTTQPQNVALFHRLSALARSFHTTLVAGSVDVHDGMGYNASFIFDPNGTTVATYDKRQLVPFVEGSPYRKYLMWLPYSSLIGNFGVGTLDGVYAAAGLRFAPLICWESAFADLTHAQLRNGAQLLVITTDDAWFGETSGPFMHAQIAQMRAIEAGTWIVRAASTGISGIIAPDGRYVQHTDLDRQAVVLGLVGPPPSSVFARVGPTPVMLALALLYVLFTFALPRMREAR